MGGPSCPDGARRSRRTAANPAGGGAVAAFSDCSSEAVRGDLFETRRDSLALAREISRDLASES